MRLENGFRSLDSTKRNHKMRFRENCTCQRNQRIKGNVSCILKKKDLELKKGNYLVSNKEFNRRPLSSIDQNRTDSVTSTTDLSDSVFADAR